MRWKIGEEETTLIGYFLSIDERTVVTMNDILLTSFMGDVVDVSSTFPYI